MGWKLILEIQCDVCGNELEMNYPPTAYGHEPFSGNEVADLNVEAIADLKEKGWTRPNDHDDQWGNPITIRCKECVEERRWK